MSDYKLKHTGAVIDKQIDRVLDGSVVVENTLTTLDETSNKPVSGVAVKGAIRPMEAANNIITVSVGSYQDADGTTLVTRTDRARTSVILRKDLVGQYIAPPIGYYFYTFLLDKNLKKIDVKNWVGTANSPLDIDALPENVVYLTMAIKNSYDGNTVVTEEDITVLQNWVNTALSPISKTAEWEYVIRANRGVENAITIKDGIVSIQASGFGIIWKGNLYYVANTDTSATTPYAFNIGQYGNHYLVLNTRGLLNKDARNELSELVSMRSYIREGDIPIAYHYLDKQVVLLGQFNDLYGANSIDAKLDNTSINADILFAPDYYSFCRGKKIDSEGVGTAWFKRFTLAHFTDIHNFYDLFAEGLNVVQSKVNAVINCGDNSRGVSADDVPIVKEDLQDIMNVVFQNNKLPYIPNVGNHDFTGLTKKEYFDIVCANISGITWGNEAGYRTYGYRDFTDSTYEGNYRVIMLDPFDYNDGQYSNPYYNMYVVFSQNQINWLIDTLEDAASKGLNVITTMHFSFGDNNLPFGEELAKPDAHYCQDAFMIPDIIKAIQNKATLNKTYTDSQGINNVSINEDFTNVAQLKYVCHLFGHIHSKNAYQCQKTGGEKYDMLMLGELSLAQNGIALAKTYREQGTVNNMSFSVLAIDTEEQSVYRISYGAYRDYSDPTKNNRVTKHSYRFND